uniref:AB hydrolase-1 domain-containing protein n=1 Tax=Fibrocapsa japonica TaxID=94617 RepID=A0A7S2UW57_9STRA|mmetsp:Transcript_1637/g.2264  ORF Transcript_1637/g.2264 Transcript_1637/m.2264 type:complete len:428 (+) Transcript_1637:102-1385(+)
MRGFIFLALLCGGVLKASVGFTIRLNPAKVSMASSSEWLERTSTVYPPQISIGEKETLKAIGRAKVESFQPRQYVAPFWAKNCHINTIIGSGEVQRRYFGQPQSVPPYRRERWTTPDGDFIDIDFYQKNQFQLSERVVVILHGLESTSSAPLTSKMAFAMARKGFDVAVMCFRSCSGEDNRTPGAYHLGFTDDIRFVVRALATKYDQQGLTEPRRIYLSGFSLGGNVIAKYLGELGEEAFNLGVCGGAVACVPFDCVASQNKIDGGTFNRRIYSQNFLKTLIPKAERQAEKFPGIFDIDAIREIKTIGEFDDEFISKIYGFMGKEDYYTQSSSKQYLPNVAVPLLGLNAIDDPFIDQYSLPNPAEVRAAPVRLVYHKNGGHCGFVSSLPEYQGENKASRDWLADELARFIGHIDTSSDDGAGFVPQY